MTDLSAAIDAVLAEIPANLPEAWQGVRDIGIPIRLLVNLKLARDAELRAKMIPCQCGQANCVRQATSEDFSLVRTDATAGLARCGCGIYPINPATHRCSAKCAGEMVTSPERFADAGKALPTVGAGAEWMHSVGHGPLDTDEEWTQERRDQVWARIDAMKAQREAQG